jgi:hypothetical protein
VADKTSTCPFHVIVTGSGGVAGVAGVFGVPLIVRLYTPNGTFTLTVPGVGVGVGVGPGGTTTFPPSELKYVQI